MLLAITRWTGSRSARFLLSGWYSAVLKPVLSQIRRNTNLRVPRISHFSTSFFTQAPNPGHCSPKKKQKTKNKKTKQNKTKKQGYLATIQRSEWNWTVFLIVRTKLWHPLSRGCLIADHSSFCPYSVRNTNEICLLLLSSMNFPLF